MHLCIVRPHLEHCVQACIPYRRKDIYMLEKIQRRANKPIPGLRYLTSCEDRLKECGLTRLETRRLRGKRTRGHDLTLVKKRSRLDVDHTCQLGRSQMTETFPIDDARALTGNGRRACTSQILPPSRIYIHNLVLFCHTALARITTLL